jgi:hypothetical protein
MILGLTVTALLSSCSKNRLKDTAGTFESVIKDALQDALDTDPACLAVAVPSGHALSGKPSLGEEALESLVNVGLLNKVSAMVPESEEDKVAAMKGLPPRNLPGVRYDFTDKGKQFIGKSDRSGTSAKVTGIPQRTLCFGKKKVVKIVRYSNLAGQLGQTATEVTYLYSLVDVAAWAEDADVRKKCATDMELRAVAQPQEAKMTLVLMSDGWHAAQSAF